MARAQQDTMVTLRVAADAAKVSVSALRKWYRNGTIRSEMVEGPNGPQRVVALADVMERATKFQALAGARELTERESNMDEEVLSGRGLLIPRDDWAKMMASLGDMLELSRDTAEAKAEAAKERTANEFLRERVNELRSKLEAAEEQLAQREAAATAKRRWRREA